jgi:RNA polymerase sigma-70 factor (ECF subfamily)
VSRDADDETLVSLLVAREPRAVELLYERWGPLAYALALRIVHDPAEAEKVVLDAYMTLWRQPEVALEHYDSLRAYLCALIACDARLRYLRCRPRHHDARTVSDTPLEAIHPAPHAAPANARVVGLLPQNGQ